MKRINHTFTCDKCGAIVKFDSEPAPEFSLYPVVIAPDGWTVVYGPIREQKLAAHFITNERYICDRHKVQVV